MLVALGDDRWLRLPREIRLILVDRRLPRINARAAPDLDVLGAI